MISDGDMRLQTGGRQQSVNLRWPSNGLLFTNVPFIFEASTTVVNRSYTADAQKTDANSWVTCRTVGENTENVTKINVLSTFRTKRPYFLSLVDTGFQSSIIDTRTLRDIVKGGDAHSIIFDSYV